MLTEIVAYLNPFPGLLVISCAPDLLVPAVVRILDIQG